MAIQVVWVQLLRGEEKIGTPDQIELQAGSNVAQLRKALNVLKACDKPEYLRADVELQGITTTFDMPLFIHAPAPSEQFFNALNVVSNYLRIAVRPAGVGEEVDLDGQKRRKVTVNIECYDEDVAAVINARLKQGSMKVGPLTYSSDLYVTNPAIFNECLQWKYDNTKEQWQSVEDAYNAL
ncbi:MAG: hypothetical protein SGPRY_011335 [Prymnesium sp.]